MLQRRVIAKAIFFLPCIFSSSCQPPGVNQRILHQPHSLYLEQLAQNEMPRFDRSQLAAVRTEELGKIGLPSSCESMISNHLFCLQCDDDPVPVKRCRKGINTRFSVEKYCRYTATSVKCLDPKTKLSLTVPLRGNQDGRFLVQFDMILETLDIIFRNEISDQNELLHAKSVLELVGASKIGLFHENQTEFDPEAPKILEILAKHSVKERKIIAEKLRSGYAKLEKQRLSGDLSSEDALEFLIELFEVSRNNPKIISIVKEVDVQGLNSL
ncbi:MAG: hypothetical protein ACOH5I_23020 [Oligoflexus sp.]